MRNQTPADAMKTERQYLRLKKLTGKDIVRIAAKHNLRELQAELGAESHIDHTRIRLNQVIAGAATAAEVAASAERLMQDAHIGNLRRDAVRGVEIVISLPAASNIDPTAYFADSLIWVRSFFNVPVLSAVIHLDESCVGFAPDPLPVPEATISPDVFSRSQDDAPSEFWDSERGEFREAPMASVQ